MAAIIKETQSIKQAVTLINGIDPGKFPRLLSRILQKLHLKAERSFSEEEEEKLQSAFSLEKQDLQLILETVSFILEQAVYHNVKPASLQQQLENVHLNPEKAEAFAQAWATTGQETVEKFRQRMFAPKKLESVGWQLSLQMAQSTQAKMKSPCAVLELGVRSEDSESFFIMLGYGCKPGSLKEKTTTNQYFWDMPATGQNSEKMFVEFSHEELLDFYNTLETIQAQLDSLT